MSRPAPLLLFALLLAGEPAAAKSLHWRALDLQARLDADGALHVVERQTMVFTGRWNGGERVFRVPPGQRLSFHRLTRVDPETGIAVEVLRGELDEVDRYDWTSRHTLRWRSRLPDDPPFDGTAIVYRLDYSLTGLLRPRGRLFRLDHDFAFPNRVGVIERFTLDLSIDPAWQVPRHLTGRIERTGLPPGESVVVTADLAYLGEGHPAGVERSLAWPVAMVLALALGYLAWRCRRLLRHERKQGRFDEPAMPEALDRAWLDEHLFDLPPEVAGALWDQSIGPAEVAAVVARMVAEGKLTSRVERKGVWLKRDLLSLGLEVHRTELTGYERRLVDKLFFGDRSTVDVDQLRKRYKSTGLNLVALIRSGIRNRLRKVPGGSSKLPKASPRSTLAIFGAFALFLALEGLYRAPAAAGAIAAGLVVVTPPFAIWAYVAGARYRSRYDRPRARVATLLVPLVLLTLASLSLTLPSLLGRHLLADLRPGVFGLLALALLPLAIASSVLHRARTRDRRGIVAKRQLLTHARRLLRQELGRPTPDLDDAWLPYLLAFGLARGIDRWFRSFGGGTGAATTRLAGAGGPSPANAQRGWSGGGGAFGGAGATASWAAAATGLASGVARPSSGGLGGGGGGGGGSSGGGGGGGW